MTYFKDLTNLAGFPAHISSAGIDLVTTEPAPMIDRAPMWTPLQIIEQVPLKASS